MLYLGQRQACDGIEVLGPGDPHAGGGAAAPWRGRLDAIGAVAPEPEVRQRLGQAGQRGVDKVAAQHTAGDQRRGEVPEGGGEDPGRIGQVRVGGKAFGRQAGIPAAGGVLAHGRGHDRDSAPVAGRGQAAMAADAQALQRGRADPGILETGRQLRPHPAGRGMLARGQRTSALDGGPPRSPITSGKTTLR